MTAIVLHDLGSRKESRGWFATAAAAAKESGDSQLHAWALAREAMVPLNYGALSPRRSAGTRQPYGPFRQGRPQPVLAAAVTARAYAPSHQPEQARHARGAAERQESP
ncbi:hypothetical protein [Streptomyces cinerochromogenes]|uniref:hypothetical protein n=1 Tax=Streptomyces cinerochromogenes TaxID=66422 RepID=UPI0033A1E063